MALEPPYVRPRRLWLLRVPIRFSPPQCRFDHDASGVLNCEGNDLFKGLPPSC
jgi:hypothetical protein